jgi:hypothetical protein
LSPASIVPIRPCFFIFISYAVKFLNFIIRGYLQKSIAENTADEQTIEEVLNFYNMATSTILNFLATEIGKASSSNNWRHIMTSFNTIKVALCDICFRMSIAYPS